MYLGKEGVKLLATIMAKVILPTDPKSEEGMARLDNISIQIRKECFEYQMLAVKEIMIPPKSHDESSDKLLEEIVKKAKIIDNEFRPGKDSLTSSDKNDLHKPKGKGCYIATACYGSYTHPDVQIFRSFRDNVLMHTIWGRLFISVYYNVSPPLARRIANVRWLATGIRKFFLQPIARQLRKNQS
jgi:hypothetical protein